MCGVHVGEPRAFRYAADPENLVQGTNMAFLGMPDPDERRALLAYLETLDD